MGIAAMPCPCFRLPAMPADAGGPGERWRALVLGAEGL